LRLKSALASQCYTGFACVATRRYRNPALAAEFWTCANCNADDCRRTRTHCYKCGKPTAPENVKKAISKRLAATKGAAKEQAETKPSKKRKLDGTKRAVQQPATISKEDAKARELSKSIAACVAHRAELDKTKAFLDQAFVEDAIKNSDQMLLKLREELKNSKPPERRIADLEGKVGRSKKTLGKKLQAVEEHKKTVEQATADLLAAQLQAEKFQQIVLDEEEELAALRLKHIIGHVDEKLNEPIEPEPTVQQAQRVISWLHNVSKSPRAKQQEI
jgi:hypothetical protein